jgi:hypothetical protein
MASSVSGGQRVADRVEDDETGKRGGQWRR